MPDTDVDRLTRGGGGTISCSLFWERSQVSLFFSPPVHRRRARESVNIKRRFHGLLWKGSARRFRKAGSREAVFSLRRANPLENISGGLREGEGGEGQTGGRV